MRYRVLVIYILLSIILSACQTPAPATPEAQAIEAVPGETAAALAPTQGQASAPEVDIIPSPTLTQAPAPATATLTPPEPGSLSLTSPAFKDGELIPALHACDGDDLSPQLDWSGVPAHARSLALIVDDPDAPAGEWVHWILYDLSPDLTGLPEDVQGVGVAGVNDFQELIYGGPCPPPGDPHRYFFKLYALDILLDIPEGAPKAELEAAMQGYILAQGQLMGLYDR